MKKIIRAIDVGYGNTKFTKGNMGSDKIPVGLIPSLAPVMQDKANIDIGLGNNIDITNVTVNGVKYCVGKDVSKIIDSRYSSPTHYDYTHTNEYLALNYGALLLMGIREIDHLVVGLPIHLVNNRKEHVEKALTGKIWLNDKTSVTIKHVKVIPQPMGGFFQYLNQNKLLQSDEVYESRNLIIDPGYFTFDWVVTNGLNVNDQLSGAVEGGMSEVLTRISKELEKDPQLNPTQTQLNNLHMIDKGIVSNNLILNGHRVDIKNYLTNAHEYTQNILNNMLNKIGSGTDIHNIILVGGPAPLFQQAISTRFPGRNIHILSEPMYANVRGFQIIGELLSHTVKGEK